MKIELHRTQCMAHGVCMELAPDYFAPDEDGYVTLRPGAERLGDTARLRQAELNCPMQVILVREDAGESVREGEE